ncbi:phospholipase A2 inhibitor and Ly6/PLAUR domain-containing protein, partial [Xenopus laevis]|uniref:Phospholipase A2 inhibitor and Ly6/PLAUR domain-containing protein n=1 Tax=Xenopus laevis TaxID=8355 RepID=A0A8J1L7U4_XENLA
FSGLRQSKGCATKNLVTTTATPVFFRDAFEKIDEASPHSVVNSLVCPGCHSYTDECHYHPVHCEGEENVCLTEKISTKFDPDTEWYPGKDKENEFEVMRRCGKAAECNRVGTFTSKIKTFTINTTCCNSSLCLSPVPTLPTQASSENGLTCPTCYTQNSMRCIGLDPLNCVGNENRCIHYTKKEFYENTLRTQSLYGCTTESICRLGSSKIKFLFRSNKTFKTITMDMMCSGSMRLNFTSLSYMGFLLVGVGLFHL